REGHLANLFQIAYGVGLRGGGASDEGRPLEDLADVFPAYPKSALTDIDYLSANTQPKFKSAQNGR
ncbi:MAG: hypothetical protein WBD83_14885, partial [Xanthobacteraceae bacterium]